MRSYLTIALFAFPILANLALGQQPSVKILSYGCDTHEGLETSGVPVRFRGKTYILTSQWGILEEETGICHEITIEPAQEKLFARAAYFDWGSGIALLEIPPKLEPVFDFDTLNSPATITGELNTQGFPTGKTLPESRKTRIVSLKSARHHFPVYQSTYEVGTERIDSGFIGAPIYSGKNLEAIVSSQWVEIIAGTRARIHEWKNLQTDRPTHLIALPINLIAERLKKLTNERASFQPLESKLKDRELFYLGGIRWKLNCPESAGKPPKDGIGPIGGADGAGIGGTMKGSETCTFEISHKEDPGLSKPDFLDEAFLKTLEENIKLHGTFSVPFLYDRDGIKNIVRIPFLTIPGFFKEISAGKKLPVLVLPKAPTQGSTSAYDKLRLENLVFRGLLEETYPKVNKLDDERLDYRKLYALSLLLDSTYWKKVTWFDLQHALGIFDHSQFAKGIEYKGQSLRLVLQAQLLLVEKRYKEAEFTL